MTTDFADVLRTEGINSRGFGIIPKIVMQDQRLTRGAKLIYAYFCSFAGAGEIAFPGSRKICDDLGFGCEDTYRKHRALLTKYGYLGIKQVRGPEGKFRNNIFTLCQFPDTEFENHDNTAISPSPSFTGTVKHGDRETRGLKETYNLKLTSLEKEEERQTDIRDKMSNLTGINFNTKIGKEAIQRWMIDHGVELTLLAGEVTAQYAHKPNIQYIENTLQDWISKGWTIPDKIRATFRDKPLKKRRNDPPPRPQVEYEIYIPPDM